MKRERERDREREREMWVVAFYQRISKDFGIG